MTTERLILKQGDWQEQLRLMPCHSVHCIITSPPYWGLRDYGTSKWEGGSAKCNHVESIVRIRRNLAAAADKCDGATRTHRKDGNEAIKLLYRNTCGKCGAKRVDQQLGLEATPQEYVEKLVTGFREAWRVLRDDGTLWLNLGDARITQPILGGSSTDPLLREGRDRAGGMRCNRTDNPAALGWGLKHKDLVGLPWRVAIGLQTDGWYLRSDTIWSKPNPMPESVTDRPTSAHEYIFLLTKKPQYFYDHYAIKEKSSGTAHDRGNGVHAKLRKNGPNSRMEKERAEGKEQSKPNASLWSTRPKQNENYAAAVTRLVSDRNKRDVWTVASAPYKGAHFATFPPDLVRPCILAGTSARGCCPSCGAQWIRLVEKPKLEKAQYTGKYAAEDHRASNMIGALMVARANGGDHDNPFPPAKTIGWEPSCKCDLKDAIPCTVLDPFCGSGTVGAVAVELGRRAVLIDLSTDYAALAKIRTNVTPGLPLA